MKLNKDDLRLYAITDRSWLKEKQSIFDIVEEALAGGATMIQVREKALKREDFIKQVLAIKPLCHRYSVPLIVNDDVYVAIESKADGVHVGQNDLDSGYVRKMIPSSMILGVSTQTVEQSIRAEKMGADYLGVGAIFPTSTKDDASSLNVNILKEITSSVSLPIVAIGGICEHNICKLENSGIAGISLISAIFAQPDIQKTTSDLLEIVKRTKF